MTLLIIILLVSLILAPLIDIALNERFRSIAKGVVLGITFVYVVYVLIGGRVV
jgi:hypothetical protein